MHKEELIKYLSRKHRRSQRHYQEAINEIFAGIQHSLAEGKELTIMGFGTFYTRMHKPGKGINFKTKKQVEYKAQRRAGFRPGTLLKQAVRKEKKANRNPLSLLTRKKH